MQGLEPLAFFRYLQKLMAMTLGYGRGCRSALTAVSSHTGEDEDQRRSCYGMRTTQTWPPL